MLNKLLSHIHLLIIAYIAYTTWELAEDLKNRTKREEQKIPGIQSRIERKQKELKEVEKFIAESDQMKKRIEAIAEEIQKSQKRLPDTLDKPFVLQQIKTIAQGLNHRDIKTSDTRNVGKKDFYFIDYFEIDSIGTYLQFLIFLEKISLQKRILNISKMKLTRSRRSKRGRFELLKGDITLESYRFDPASIVNDGISEIEERFKGGKKGKKGKGRRR